jgi:hypothetical protein
VPDTNAITTAIGDSHSASFPVWGVRTAPHRWLEFATTGTCGWAANAVDYQHKPPQLLASLRGFLIRADGAPTPLALFLRSQKFLLLVSDFFIVAWATTLAVVSTQV